MTYLQFSQILRELEALKNNIQVLERNTLAINGWLPKKAVLRFFNYGETQLRELEKLHMLIISKIGHRKFYSIDSIEKLIGQFQVKN